MSAFRPAARKHHAPRHVGGAAVQFPIDKIADPPQAQPDRHGDRGQIADGIERKATPAAKQPDCQDGPQQTSVKRHAAFPHRDHLCGMLEVVRQVIEQHVAQSASDKDSDRRIDDQIVELVLGNRHAARGRSKLDHEISRRQRQQVHQAVPSELQGTEPEKDRIDIRIRNHGLAFRHH